MNAISAVRPLPVGVIGGGLGGLAAACTLAARGHRSSCSSKNAWLGGKAAVLEEDGFRFDMGPTILTVPRVLERIFAEAGQRMDDYLDLRRLDPQWRCFFDDGSVLDLHEDVAAMARRARSASRPAASAGYRDFIAMSRQAARGVGEVLLLASVEGIARHARPAKNIDLDTLRDVLSLRMGTHGRRARSASGCRDARVAQMLDHFVQYVGSSPYASPAVLCSIAHMQTERRRVVSDGRHARGAGGAGDAGRRARRGSAAPAPASREIATEGGRASGVVTAARRDASALSAVVSNMDSVRTYRELVRRRAGAALRPALEARAGLFGRGALSRARPRLRASGAP